MPYWLADYDLPPLPRSKAVGAAPLYLRVPPAIGRTTKLLRSLAIMLSFYGWIVVGVLLHPYAIAALMRPDLTILWRSATGLVHPYRAPLNFCDKSHVVPKEYHVQLRPECSLEEHWRRMGLDTANIVNITPKNPWFPTAYHAQGIDDSVLDAIRADIMVDMVKCHREWSASDGETRELVDTPWDELGRYKEL